MNNCVEVTKLTKSYDGMEKPLFNGLSFSLDDSAVISGVSGSGKSTLLQIIAGLDSSDSGEIKILGKDITKINKEDLNQFRKKYLGFVYQFHHLLNDFTAVENVMLPLQVNGMSYAESYIAAKKIINEVGLGDRLNHFPNQLSGGERQRIAICRAIIHKPKLIFADEPTGNLDKKNSQLVMQLLFKLVKLNGIKIILVTHDQSILKKFKNRFLIIDGKLKKC